MNAGKTLFAQVMELARTWGRTGSLPRSKASGRRDSVNFLSGRCEKIDFAEISSEPKCMPKAQRSLIRHPGATFFKAEIAPRF